MGILESLAEIVQLEQEGQPGQALDDLFDLVDMSSRCELDTAFTVAPEALGPRLTLALLAATVEIQTFPREVFSARALHWLCSIEGTYDTDHQRERIAITCMLTLLSKTTSARA